MLRTITISAVLIFLNLIPLKAAEFTFGDNDFLHCKIKMTGTIEPGDSIKLRVARIKLATQYPNIYFPSKANSIDIDSELEKEGRWFKDVVSEREWDGISRICLDSPGGSFLEALKIADELAGLWGTAVASGDICESACSIVFMAGSRSDEEFGHFRTDRVLHARGKLGFHAPSLAVADGDYNGDAIEKAFNVAIKSLAGIHARQYYLKMGRSLIGAMLETESNSMSYVETVSQAIRWQIFVAGTKWPVQIDLIHAANACERLFEARQEFGEIQTLWINERNPAHLSLPADKQYSFLSEDSHLKGLFSQTFLHSPENIWRNEDGILRGFESSYSAFNTGTCEISLFDPRSFGKELPIFDYTSPFSGVRGDANVYGFEYETTPAMFWPPETKLIDIARANNDQIELVAIPNERIDQERIFDDLSCFVFSAGTVVDRERCSLRRYNLYDKNLVSTYFQEFQWPSGSRTIVKREGKKTFINNQLAVELEWDMENPEIDVNFPKGQSKSDYTECWFNTVSRNLMCYKFGN